MWLHGQGFPKGMDISKALDKHLGQEREVIGDKVEAGIWNTAKTPSYCYGKAGGQAITAPASPEL